MSGRRRFDRCPRRKSRGTTVGRLGRLRRCRSISWTGGSGWCHCIHVVDHRCISVWTPRRVSPSLSDLDNFPVPSCPACRSCRTDRFVLRTPARSADHNSCNFPKLHLLCVRRLAAACCCSLRLAGDPRKTQAAGRPTKAMEPIHARRAYLGDAPCWHTQGTLSNMHRWKWVEGGGWAMAMHKLRAPQNTKNERNCSRFSNFEVVYEYLSTSREAPIPTSSFQESIPNFGIFFIEPGTFCQ